MFSIRQNENGTWDVLIDGRVVRVGLAREAAIAALGTFALPAPVAEPEASAQPPGTLPRRWRAVLVEAAPTTSDPRDLTDATFTWREPPMPLMFQQVTDDAHDGAQLAGFMDTIEQVGTTPTGGGWLFDNAAGRDLAMVLDAQGRFGISVDGGLMEGEWVCDQMGDDGWCEAEHLAVTLLEIIGATAAPFPAFAQAFIEWDGAPAEPDQPVDVPAQEAAPVPAEIAAAMAAATLAVAAVGQVLPPAAWFTEPEPADGDSRLVRQPDGQHGVPLTITDAGQVFGHAALWGTCHTGIRERCVTPPPSPSDYAHFHLGAVDTDAGQVATGTLMVGGDHAALSLLAPQARDHYANTHAAWADVRASSGRHGVWLAGAVRAEVLANPDLLRVLRASAVSGDWRTIGGQLDLLAVQSVNVPGFPVVREALAAAGTTLPLATGAQVAERYGTVVALVAPSVVVPASPEVEALVAAGTIERCPTCGGRSQHAVRRSYRPATNTDQVGNVAVMARLDELCAQLRVLDLRTRHLAPDAQLALRRRLSR